MLTIYKNNFILYFILPIILFFGKNLLIFDEELIIVLCICIVFMTLVQIIGNALLDSISNIKIQLFDFYQKKLKIHYTLSYSIIHCINNIDRVRVSYLNVYVVFLLNIYKFYSKIYNMQLLYFNLLILENLFNLNLEENNIIKLLNIYKSNLYFNKVYYKFSQIFKKKLKLKLKSKLKIKK